MKRAKDPSPNGKDKNPFNLFTPTAVAFSGGDMQKIQKVETF